MVMEVSTARPAACRLLCGTQHVGIRSPSCCLLAVSLQHPSLRKPNVIKPAGQGEVFIDLSNTKEGGFRVETN